MMDTNMKKKAPSPKPTSSSTGLTQLVNNRMPLDLHAKMKTAAARSARSLTGEINERLEQSFRTDPRIAKLWNALESVVPIRTRRDTSPATVDHVLNMLDLFEVEGLMLSAVEDPQYGSPVLVLLIQTPSHSIVVDQAGWTLSRPPRVEDLKRLFAGIHERGHLSTARYWTSVVTDYPRSVTESVPRMLKAPVETVGEYLAPFLTLLAGGATFDHQGFPLMVKPARTKRPR